MDLYQEITNRIIAQMEEGIIPWHKPWISGKAISRTTGKPYSLLNQMLLGRPGEYLTFKQCQDAGGKIKKGEKASIVVFWKWIETEDEETGEKKEVPFLRYYNVFHIDQCEGITAKNATPIQANIEPDAQAEQIIAVNTDPQAPICSLADIVVEADAADFTGKLIERIDRDLSETEH